MNDWIVLLAMMPFALAFSWFMGRGRDKPKPRKITFYV